ncbi:hypothetical protein BJV74DRAFT_797682 [Russula compacta]|nr:hypothetical protein BJV74DRAFT_797682 [Russula compacta]
MSSIKRPPHHPRSPSPGSGHTRDPTLVQYLVPTPTTSPFHDYSYPPPCNPSSSGTSYSTDDGVQSPGSSLPSSSELYSSMGIASNSYSPLDANYASNLPTISKIPPPLLSPPVRAQTPARSKHAFEYDSLEDVVALGTQGFAQQLSQYLLDEPDRRSLLGISSSEQTQLSTNTAPTSSITPISGLDRNLTGSTLTLPTMYSSASADEDTIAEGTTIDYGDSYSSQLEEDTPGPTQLCELHQSEPSSEATGARRTTWFRDRVPRGTHLKGDISYLWAFTGRDIVSTLQSGILSEPVINRVMGTNSRAIALQVARSLQQQVFFYVVEWCGPVLQDSVEDVYMFLDDQETTIFQPRNQAGLPTSVITSGQIALEETPSPVPVSQNDGWAKRIHPVVLATLSESEMNRQIIIHALITKATEYLKGLDIIESVFIRPLRNVNPPVIPYSELNGFIDERVGDIFLQTAKQFRLVYPPYLCHVPRAEQRLDEETERNHEFQLFLENANRNADARRMGLKVFLNRPSEHLDRYENMLEAIAKETTEGNPDADYLMEALQAFKNVKAACVLQTFQHAMCKSPTNKFKWHNLVANDARAGIDKSEQRRQSIIFELIKGEMQYVRDLENVDVLSVTFGIFRITSVTECPR